VKRILVIEDDPAILKGLVTTLETSHYKVVAASDGLKGYKLGMGKDIDLILLDLMLPGKTGEDICRDLRAQGIKIPIMMLTSKSGEADKVGGFNLGADDYITKPFSTSELLARIEVRLRQRDEYRQLAEHASKLSHDLELARRVQENLFPQVLPVVDGWEFSAFCRPASTVGGDYYDLFMAAPEKIIFALGDVSGKGLGPALLMASVHSALRNRANDFLADPIGFIAGLNSYLVSSSSPETFLTLFSGYLDLKTGSMRYVNSGHLQPVMMREGKKHTRLSDMGSTVLGIFEKLSIACHDLDIDKGDVLMLYSDGVTEARNKSGELFGESRLTELLSGASHRNASRVIDSIIKSVDEFAGHCVQADDISLLVIRRL
jgi:sigma-B regulation protein RsbU (phosphoserine phosphatase)